MGRLVVVVGALLSVLLVHGSASAEPPLEVTGQITDEVGALGTGAAPAREAVEELAAEQDVGLYTVFVSSFDSIDAGAWAEATAELSELDESDLLLAVAVGEDTYEYGWWVDESSPLSVVDIEDAMSDAVRPHLEADQWSGAVVTLSEQLRSLAAPAAEVEPAAEDESAAEDASAAAEASSGGQWSATTTLLVVGGVVLVLLVAHLLSRRRPPADPVR